MASLEDAPTTDVTPISSPGYTWQQKIILVSSLLAEFFCCSCLSLPAPFLPKLDESHHIGSDFTGWTLAMLPLTMLFLSPAMGSLMSCVVPEFLLVYGMFFTGGSTVLFGLLEFTPLPPESESNVDVVYLVLAMIVRAGQGVGSSAVLTSTLVILSKSFKEDKNTILSYSEVSIGLGVMCGPALGSGLYKLGGFKVVFFGVGGIMLLLFLIIRCILPHNGTVERVGETREKASLKTIFTNTNLILSFVLTAVTGSLWTSIDPILEPELRKKFNLMEELCSLTFLLISLAYSITAPLVGRALDKLKCLDSLTLLIAGFSLASANFVFMGPSPLFQDLHRPLWLLLVCLAVMGIALGFIIVPCLELLSHDDNGEETDQAVMNDATKALALSFWNSAYSFGDFTGPTFSGIATRHGTFGWTMTYYSIGCMAMAAVVVVIKCVRSCKRRCVSQRGQGETTPLLANHE